MTLALGGEGGQEQKSTAPAGVSDGGYVQAWHVNYHAAQGYFYSFS
jgi:hypothetical protein